MSVVGGLGRFQLTLFQTGCVGQIMPTLLLFVIWRIWKFNNISATLIFPHTDCNIYLNYQSIFVIQNEKVNEITIQILNKIRNYES